MNFSVKVFTDASSVSDIQGYAEKEWVSGFTTNPTLLSKGGVQSYRAFALEAVEASGGKSLSLEVIADDLPTMERQGLVLGSWGANVVVKIPITTTEGQSCLPVVRNLLDAGISVNVTAVMTDQQVRDLLEVLAPKDTVILSVFAGRIADTGIDPVPVMTRYAEWIDPLPGTELLWASPREILNIFQAGECGCDIITVTPDLLQKLKLIGKDLEQFSRETVKMFYEDGVSAGLDIV